MDVAADAPAKEDAALTRIRREMMSSSASSLLTAAAAPDEAPAVCAVFGAEELGPSLEWSCVGTARMFASEDPVMAAPPVVDAL